MSYGHPFSSGHGRRVPTYRWSPTVLPPSQRRARHAGYTRHYSYVPRFRFSTPGWRTSSYRASRDRTQRALPTREPSLGKLLGKGVVSLTGGILKFLADEALAGRRVTKSFENFLSFCLVLAVMSSSLIGLVLGAFYLFVAYMDDFAGSAATVSMKEYDEAKKRICITRKTSAEAPPTPGELRRAWEAARGRGALAAKLLVGTLLSNLEPSVDQSYLRAEDGTIVGRRPGLKGWLRGYCPDLVPHYKALMSYKALADKLRVALGIEEPDTLSGIIDFGEMSENPLKFKTSFRLQSTNEQTVRKEIHSLFGALDSAEPEHGTAIESGRRTKVGGKEESAMEGREGKFAKTSVFSTRTDTSRPCAGGGPWGSAGAATMAALEAVVRERLGLCWMRRAGRRPRPA